MTAAGEAPGWAPGDAEGRGADPAAYPPRQGPDATPLWARNDSPEWAQGAPAQGGARIWEPEGAARWVPGGAPVQAEPAEPGWAAGRGAWDPRAYGPDTTSAPPPVPASPVPPVPPPSLPAPPPQPSPQASEKPADGEKKAGGKGGPGAAPAGGRSRRSAPALPPGRRYRIRPGDLKCLWAGQTVSMFGDEITAVALPTVALLLLHASPFQFGLIGASTYLPYPVLGLLVGAWVDRVRRRTVLLIADAVRGAAIFTIPVAVMTGTLTFVQLVLVGLVVGTASVFFNSAYQAYLPHLVATDTLNKANSRLSVSETASQVAGPTLAGGLISVVGVAGAMVLDAFSFAVSVFSLMFIRRPEAEPQRKRSSLIPDVREGLQLVLRHRLLLSLTLTSAASNLGRGMALGLVVLFAYNGLHLSPALVGVMLAAGNAGPFLGSLVSQRFTARVGIGPALLIGSVMKGLPWVFTPLALFGGAVPVIVMVMIVSGFFIPISNVTTLTIRQTLVSSDMQGRVAATVRTVTRTAVPLATIMGGALAELGTSLLGPRAGLAAVLVLGGLIWTSAGGLLPRRTLRRLHSIDDLDDLEETVTAEPANGDTEPQRERRRVALGAAAGARARIRAGVGGRSGPPELIDREADAWLDDLVGPRHAIANRTRHDDRIGYWQP